MRVLPFAIVAWLLCTAAAQAAPGVLTPTSPNARENGGSVTISVTRQGGSTGVVTVDYATVSRSAVAGREFTPVSGTLVFQDGERTKSVTIALIDNGTYDGNREFLLDLTNPTGGATIATYPVGTVDVYDDELPPRVSIDDIRVTEGNSGTTNAEFTISITSVQRSIDIRILWYTNSQAAVEGSDFQSSGGTFWFTPADTQKTISIPVFGDTAREYDERFSVYIYGGATFTKQYGYCTIVDDDWLLTLTANDVTVVEGNDGRTNAVFTLTANEPLTGVTVNYKTVAGTAVAGHDFEFTSGTLFFTGETQKEITVPIIGDKDVEPDEEFSVRLFASGQPVTLSQSHITATIVNDDVEPDPVVTFDPPSPTVVVGGTVTVRTTVSPFEEPVTLQLVAHGGTAAVSATVDVGADGGAFPITGLEPGLFRIDVTLPTPNGDVLTSLFGEVLAAPTVVITRLSPDSGPVNGGTEVTITGANFTSDCTFSFGHRPADNVVVVDDTTVTLTTPAHGVETVDVTATCSSGTFTLPGAFTFHPVRRRASRS